MEYFKAAASYLDRSNISASYNIHTAPSTSGGSGQPTVPPGHYSAPVRIGQWQVHRGTHATSGKLVSVWTAEKRLEGSSSSSKGKARLDRMVEVLKKEASYLSRLRHPAILEVVEPLEETRSQLIFATEPVTASLRDAIDAQSEHSSRRRRGSSALELDEVETQKGLLQVGKGLLFLHESARLVHCNLTPEGIIVNSKGDWKISGFGLSTYLKLPDGSDARWEFPSIDSRLPPAVQRNPDFIAPEYALDEVLSPANDLYSLGCIVHSIHTRGGPPFTNRTVEDIRRNAQDLPVLRAGWSRLADEVQDVLAQLLTRYPSNRMTASSFLNSRYFSSNVLVATLAFLDRDTFNSKQREEQVQFFKGLTRILPQFSERMIRRKILPSLLEETRKHMLLPFLLPNVFYIAKQMEVDEFREQLLPHLTPLFSIRDPPQSMLTLLEHLDIFQEKATPQTFREDVMPLIYAALDSDIPQVQERALRVIPGLAETLEYTHVKQVLFPKVQAVFSKTTMLSVKVNTLRCFYSMVPILDKFTLTEKLVPLLSKIKTKEPAVMVATLAVHEAMGKKVEIISIATLILPQLWAMSMGPLLNADQFARFMTAIQRLGDRVREEHSRHLAEVKRLEESSGGPTMGAGLALGADGEVDFAALVGGGSSARAVPQDPFGGPSPLGTPGGGSPALPASPWGDDPAPNGRAPMRLGATGTSSKAAALLGAKPLPRTTFETGAPNEAVRSFAPPPRAAPSFSNGPSAPTSPPIAPAASAMPWSSQGSMLQPMQAQRPRPPPVTTPSQPSASGPNYNIALPSQAPTAAPLAPAQFAGLPPLQPQTSSLASLQPKPVGNAAPNGGWNVVKPQAPPGFSSSGMLQPTKAPQNPALADFDPFA